MTYPREISTTEASQILGVDPSTVREHIAAGTLRARDISPPGRVRRRWRVLYADVEALRTDYDYVPPPSRYQPRHL